VAEPFSLVIDAPKLIRGLRPSKRVPRDSAFLVQCQGAVGRVGSLQGLDALTRMATTAITDSFPYPQLFMFTNFVVVCGLTTIYEWNGSTLVSKLTATAGSPWTAVDFHNYIYLSNGVVAVIRRATDGVYAVDSALPKAESLLNVHGQVMVGGYS